MWLQGSYSISWNLDVRYTRNQTFGAQVSGLRYRYLRGVIRDPQFGFAALLFLGGHDGAPLCKSGGGSPDSSTEF